MAGTEPGTTRGSRAAALSNHVVRVMSEYTGRGPTKARAHITEDLVTVVLQDTLTRGERSLVADGQVQYVMDMRKAFQRTMRSALVSGVEEITGRRVIAFMSDNHTEPDVALEAFLLAPEEESADGAGSWDGAAPGDAAAPG